MSINRGKSTKEARNQQLRHSPHDVTKHVRSFGRTVLPNVSPPFSPLFEPAGEHVYTVFALIGLREKMFNTKYK